MIRYNYDGNLLISPNDRVGTRNVARGAATRAFPLCHSKLSHCVHCPAGNQDGGRRLHEA